MMIVMMIVMTMKGEELVQKAIKPVIKQASMGEEDLASQEATYQLGQKRMTSLSC